MPTCPAGGERPLTEGEIALVRSVFGDAINCAPVRIRRRRWWWLQPRRIVMAPCGHLHFPPLSEHYCEDFSEAPLEQQGLFIHEMVHVWQTQAHGRFWLLWRRHPFCRYGYALIPGRAFEGYGVEQQAEIVRHAFLLRKGARISGFGDRKAYDLLVTFPAASVPRSR